MRPPRPADGLRSTRRSRTFHPVDRVLQERVRATSFEGYYTFLLYEDLDFVIPYTLGRKRGCQAWVTGPDADRAEPLITRGLSGRDRTPFISDSVREFVSYTARHLVISGPVTYEIDYLYAQEAPSEDPPVEFRLELVLPGTLAYHGHQPIQYVPAAFGGPQDKTGMTYIDLDPTTLVTFRLDPATAAAVRKMVDFLRVANSLQGAEMPLIEQSTSGGTPYSFSEHQREQAELFAKVTEPIGWNARGLFQDNLLGSYSRRMDGFERVGLSAGPGVAGCK